MKLDITRLPLGEALITFVLAATVGTFVLAFAIGVNNPLEEGEAVAEPTETPQATETPSDGGDGGGGGNLAVSMGDNFFEPKEFTVGAGETVTFDISNDGTAIHNMRVDGGDGTLNNDDDTVSDPELFTPGATGTLTWTAPDQAGTIDFRCDFHPTDMTGTITVE
jgi:plastocyanin